MATKEHLDILKQGVKTWNQWRKEHADIEPDFSRADLSRANLRAAMLRAADLGGANLGRANLGRANLSGATLEIKDLRETTLREANLSGHNLNNVDFSGMDLSGVNLNGTSLNQEIREVIDTITSKVVLILGRFTPKRKAVLGALRDELREKNYLPVVFDFEKPASRDLTETVSTLAHLARFIIVDLTDPSSAPHEVATIIPQCIVPVQPLLLQDDTQPRNEYAMFHDLRARYHWVLPTYQYKDIANLLASLKENVIAPAEQKALGLAKR